MDERPDKATYPLVRFGKGRAMDDQGIAAHFGLSIGMFRAYYTGWERPSWKRAKLWESLGDGHFTAAEVLEWHDRHCRTRKPMATASRA